MKIPHALSVRKQQRRAKKRSIRDSTDDDEEGVPGVKKLKEERL